MSTATLELYMELRGNAEKGLAAVSGSLRTLGDDTRRSGDDLSKWDQITTGAFRRVGEIATNMAVEAASAVGRFVGDSIKGAGDFEAGLNRMASVVGSSLSEAGFSLDDVKAKALDMGAKTQFSAAQAQDAMINLAKGGVPVVEIMGEATQATLDLAAAGEVELATAADIVAKQLGVWASEGVTATNVADLLAQAANASTVDVEELALGLANAGGVAKVTGVSFQDTVQTMALLAPSFSSAADAGTSYKTFLSRLIPTSDAATKTFIDLGLATEDGKSKFFDAQGSFIGMHDAAVLLQGATAGLSQEQRQLAFNTMFGSDAIRAAAAIAEAGGAGFDKMGLAMLSAGTAADQAAQRSQGFNFALDSLMGSAETLGIVAASLLLPALTSLINNALIPGVNAVTEFFGALTTAGSPAATLAGTIGSLVMPAITGLTAALIAYAIVQTVQAIPAIYASIPALAASATAFYANAAAITAALAPYALIALAIGGVVMAYQNFTAKVTDASTALLESRQWWNDSAAALVAYNAASQSTQTALSAQAETIRTLRAEIQGEVEDLGKRMAAGMVSDAQYTSEMAAINAKRESLIGATEAINTEIAAMVQQQAASATATNALASMAQGNQQLVQAMVLTEEELEKLSKAIEENYAKGAQAVQNYVQTEISFLDQAKEARISGDAAALQSQAARYAQEQAAQKAHLGQMLIDYTLAQVQMGNIAADKAALITQAIEKEFGVQKDISASTYLQMASDIDAFAASGSTDLDALSAQLGNTTDTAVQTQQAMDALAKQYEATLVENFMSGKINAEQLAAALRDIPERVYTEVITNHVTVYETRGDNVAAEGVSGYRAFGGPVWPGGSFVVGEDGPELFLPKVAGTIVPNDMLDLFQQQGGGGAAGDMGSLLETFKQTAEIITAGVAAFQKIAGFQSPSWEPFAALAYSLYMATVTMQNVAAAVGKEGTAAAAEFSEGAGKILALIGDGVDAFGKLANLQELPSGIFLRFGNYLTYAVYRLSEAAKSFSADTVEAAVTFTEGAGKVLAVIGDGVDALNKLGELAQPTQGAFLNFANQVSYLMYRMGEAGKSMGVDIVAQAVQFSEGAGKVLGVVGDGVDALNKLGELAEPVQGSFLNFASQIKYLVFRMSEVATSLSTDAVAAAVSFAESAGKILSIVSAGVDALSKLRDFQGVGVEAVNYFGNAIANVVDQMVFIARSFDAEGVAAAAVFSDGVGKVLAIIGAGVEGFNKLIDFQGVSVVAVNYFGNAVANIVDQLVFIARSFDAEAVAAAAVFSDGVGKVLAIIGGGVDAFAKLTEFQGVSVVAINSFGNAIANIIQELTFIAGAFDKDAVAAAGVFADGAGKVLGIVGGGVDAFSKLEGFVQPAWDYIGSFGIALKQIVDMFVILASYFATTALESAAVFADAAGKVVGVVGGGVDAFAKLEGFTQPAWDYIGSFGKALKQIVDMFITLASYFAVESLAAATVFADAAGKVVSIVGTGVDAFAKLEGFTQPAWDYIGSFGIALKQIVDMFVILASYFSTASLDAATAFAESAGKVVSVVGSGIDGLSKLAEFEGVPEAAIASFAETVRVVISAIQYVASLFTAEAMTAATTFATGAETVIKTITTALDTFKKLGEFEGVASGVVSAFTEGLTALVNEVISQVLPASTDIGAQMMIATAQGITAYQNSMINAMLAALDQLYSTALPSATDIGYYIAVGIANGISEGTPAIQNAIFAAINAALAAARTALGIASPSKVFEQLVGAQVGAGMARGIEGSTGLVSSASAGLAGAAVSGTSTSGGNTVSVNVTFAAGSIVAAAGQSVEEIAKRVSEMVVQEAQSVLA